MILTNWQSRKFTLYFGGKVGRIIAHYIPKILLENAQKTTYYSKKIMFDRNAREINKKDYSTLRLMYGIFSLERSYGNWKIVLRKSRSGHIPAYFPKSMGIRFS